MEKTEISSLDLRFLMKELKPILIDGAFRKIYQYRSRIEGRPINQFLFEIYAPGKGDVLLYVDNNKMFLTNHKKTVPQEPPSFCMFLRKHLLGKRIRNIEQNVFDRVVRIITDENILIFEFFSDGNVILCDSLSKIIMPLEVQSWKDRDIRPKSPYRYPVQEYDPFTMEPDDLRGLARKSDKGVAAFLAARIGFGSAYANELCARAKVDPGKPAQALTPEEVVTIHKAIGVVGKMKPEPCVYEDYVSPFPMESFAGKKSTRTETLSDALDNFFSYQAIASETKEEVKEITDQKERVEHIIMTQDKAKDKWERIGGESRESAEAIYSFYTTVQGAIEGIRKAREMNIPWDDIKARVRGEATPEAESIKDIREGDGIIVMELGGKTIEVDFRKSVEENAARYYEDAKWAKKKIEGTEVAMEEQKKKLDVFVEREQKKTEVEKNYEKMRKTFEGEMKSLTPEEPKEEPDKETANEAEFEKVGTLDMFAQPEDEKPAERPVEKERWYEKFKWFTSSDGLLVIAGRDADQNEEIIKRHAEPSDVVFHADIPGAAFTVIKSEGQDVSEETIKEASEFAAANSKAWQKGLGTINVYSVPRSQVTKTPPSGEHLPKGSFMISGDRRWYKDVELKLSVGINIDQEVGRAKVLAGPVMSVRKSTRYFVTIKPGFKKSAELAMVIKNKILIKAKPEDKFLIEKVPLEDFQKAIPSGTGEVAGYA